MRLSHRKYHLGTRVLSGRYRRMHRSINLHGLLLFLLALALSATVIALIFNHLQQ